MCVCYMSLCIKESYDIYIYIQYIHIYHTIISYVAKHSISHANDGSEGSTQVERVPALTSCNRCVSHEAHTYLGDPMNHAEKTVGHPQQTGVPESH